jgi:hypothetical protein
MAGFHSKLQEYQEGLDKKEFYMIVNGRSWDGQLIRPGDKVEIVVSGGAGAPNMLMAERPSFGQRQNRLSKYARFWMDGKLCDAYLLEWTTAELKLLIKDSCGAEVYIQRNGH